MPGAPNVASLLLVAMPFAPSSLGQIHVGCCERHSGKKRVACSMLQIAFVLGYRVVKMRHSATAALVDVPIGTV